MSAHCLSNVNVPALIILAAGESSRMRFPKALLKIGQETFLECIVRKAVSAGATSILIITGQDHEAIAPRAPVNTVCVRNENYMQGQISSLKKGILSLTVPVPGIIAWPVDQPLVSVETLRNLVSVYQNERKALTIPVYRQQKGHPLILNEVAMATAVKLEQHQTGKDLQAAHTNEITLVDFDDPGVVIDIDTPEDYEKYIGVAL